MRCWVNIAAGPARRPGLPAPPSGSAGVSRGTRLFVASVIGFARSVGSDGAVNVFLIPKAVYQHGGNSKRLGGEDFIHGLLLPERVVTRVVQKFAPEADLFEAMTAAKFSGGTGLQIHVVVVVVAGPPALIVLSRGALFVGVGD